jgi:outer membrane lipoprotein-sorting protein
MARARYRKAAQKAKRLCEYGRINIMNDNEKYIEEFVKDVPFDAPRQEHRDTLKTQLLSDFPKQRLQPTQRTVGVWRTIMKSRITKLAAAAVILIGVLVLFLFNFGPGSIALADVYAKVQQAQAFMYKMNATMTNNKVQTEMEGTVIISNQYGVKMESTVHIADPNLTVHQQIYAIPNEKTMMVIFPDSKMYWPMEITDNTDIAFGQMEMQSNLREMIGSLVTQKYTELGCSEIDGITVQGFQIDDEVGESTTTLWVDVDTQLLVKFEVDTIVGERESHIVMDQFRWDISVDANVFEYVIPDDYKEMGKAGTATAIDPSSIKMLEMNDQAAIKGLEVYKEFFSQYPEKIDLMSLMKSLTNVGDPNTELGKKLLEKIKRKMETVGLDQVKLQEFAIQDFVVPLQSLGTFYMTLVQDKKDPAYYGAQVTPEDTDAVLMRWKMDDGRYKVIFADLTVEEVTAEELVELESAPLNIEPKAIKPQPADGAEGTVLSGLRISWIPGAYVTEHKVYFGTNIDSLPLLGEVTTDYAELPKLERNTTYHWRVDEVQPDGSVVAGDLWSFNTGRLVAWWKFDDGSGTIATDSGDNGLDGTLVGDTSWVEGIAAGALAFDGDGDYVDAGKGSQFDIKNQITIMAWIKVGAFDRDWQSIITKGDRGWRLQRNQGTNTLEFACSGLNVPDTQWGQVYGTVDVNDGHWHHAAGTYDGSKICLYVDGILDVSSEASGNIRVNDQPVYIGTNSEMPDRFWNGALDDVRIYNYALSPDEMATIIQNANILLFK